MKLHRIEVPGLAQYSYILSSKGAAAVIDPKRDIDTYLAYARAEGLTITHILETHIHADYASGATALAHHTGAELCLSAYDANEDFEYSFAHRELRDQDTIALGDLRIEAVHTPGHTPEHLSFLVFDRTRCGQPWALFTGDFIFTGSLGRPDLLGEAAKQSLARRLYRSVHERIEQLPDGLEIYPGHGAGSLCGAGLGEPPQTTLGYERHCNIFLAQHSEEEFVRFILDTVPPFPDYYRRMKKLNATGAPILDAIPGGNDLSPQQVERLMQEEQAILIDLRRPEAFAGAHIQGSINIGAGQNLAVWAGYVVPADRPLVLIAGDGEAPEEARRALIRIGLDDIRGSLRGGIRSWIEGGYPVRHLAQVSARELESRLASGVALVDVRTPGEWRSGHVEGAVNIPAHEIEARAGEIPPGPVHVLCGTGYRASIAVSLLARMGRADAIHVSGGMAAWNAGR
jgi:hydroxyacylglutathione hydrolase